MRISKVVFKNFKRFTDLTLDNIPSSAKLVLLIGANGSGKSCVFDGFLSFKGIDESKSYYAKNQGNCTIDITTQKGGIFSNNWHNDGLHVYSTDSNEGNIRFIGRSSIRIVPRLSSAADTGKISTDADKPRTFIDPDTRFENDVFAYMQIIDDALRIPLFSSGAATNTQKIFHEFIEPLNNSLLAIFGGNAATTIRIINYQNATPFAQPQLIFSKGNSEINYNLLSHGEKQVVTLLLNFVVRKQQYENAIIFIDEMDCHLNTSLQFNLLQEIVNNWIPDSSQLWTASHALGFIDYARKSNEAVILDFDNLDFDIPQYIAPMPPDGIDVYDIAIPKAILFNILKDKKIVLCENENDEYYNLLQLPDTVFVGLKDARDLFLTVKRDERYTTLRDRDFLSDTEIDKLSLKYPHHRILRYYDFENYLYHPDNIAELKLEGFDIEAYKADILNQKNERIYYILPTLGTARQGYEEFKTEPTIKDKNTDAIVEDFRSDEFERFYKYFDMKSQYRKNMLSGFNIDKKLLVTTSWFVRKIGDLLG